VVYRLAAEMSQAERRSTETIFVGQADKEVETLTRVGERRLPNIERAVLRDTSAR
jgi:hypothetical protein